MDRCQNYCGYDESINYNCKGLIKKIKTIKHWTSIPKTGRQAEFFLRSNRQITSGWFEYKSDELLYRWHKTLTTTKLQVDFGEAIT